MSEFKHWRGTDSSRKKIKEEKEELGRGHGKKKKKKERTSSFHLFQKPERFLPFSLLHFSHLFPAISSDSFEITIKIIYFYFT